MAFRDLKPQAPKAPKPREVIVRFRVTEEEYAAIQEAAEFDGARFEAELLERGLPKSAVETLKRPSEWMRYIVMKAANPTAAEARQKRAREAERREREAEEVKARLARQAERGLERLIIETQAAANPFLNDPAIRSVLEQAETRGGAIQKLEEAGAAFSAIKKLEALGVVPEALKRR